MKKKKKKKKKKIKKNEEEEGTLLIKGYKFYVIKTKFSPQLNYEIALIVWKNFLSIQNTVADTHY